MQERAVMEPARAHTRDPRVRAGTAAMTWKAIEADVLRLVAVGWTTGKIAAAVRCSVSIVRDIRKRHGVSAQTGHPVSVQTVETKCEQCGTTFVKKPYRGIQRRFCNIKCKLSWDCDRRRKLPKDDGIRREILTRLYERENLTTVEIAARFGMNHRSVIHAMEKLGIARRPVGKSRHRICCEPDCDKPIYKVLHKTNGSRYGRRCLLHWIIYRMEVNQRYNDKHLGKDDEAWLRRMRQALARVQRLNREVSQSLRPESEQVTTSRAACQR